MHEAVTRCSVSSRWHSSRSCSTGTCSVCNGDDALERWAGVATHRRSLTEGAERTETQRAGCATAANDGRLGAHWRQLERLFDILHPCLQLEHLAGYADTEMLMPSTVVHHVRHIYDKAGVRTRAGASLFALDHNLLK